MIGYNRIINLLFCMMVIALSCPWAYGQEKKEKRVYYLDCSGSMVSSKGNIWSEVKSNLKNAISSVSDETTELVVIPFAFNTSKDISKPLNGISDFATENGKERIKRYIDNLPEPIQNTKTYHNMPISDFVNYRIDKNKETYMFLMTDGIDEDDERGFEKEVRKWNEHSDVYGIYVMLKGDIDSKRKDLIDTVDYFWWANTADVNINTIKLDKETIFNIRNEKKIVLKYKGNINGIDFKFYPIDSIPFCIGDVSVIGDKINIAVSPKLNTDVHVLDESRFYNFKVKAVGGDEFSILLTPNLTVNCISIRENSLSVINESQIINNEISPWDKVRYKLGGDIGERLSLGNVEYYPSFMRSRDSIKPVQLNLRFEFSHDAKLNKEIYAKFQFVNNNGIPYSQDILTIIDGKDTLKNNILTIYNTDSIKNLACYFSPNAKAGKYQGYFRLVNSNLHRIDSHVLKNGQSVDVFQWTLNYKKHINPLLLKLIWILLIILLLLSLLIATIFMHRLLMKKFPRKWNLAFRGDSNIELRPFSLDPFYYRGKRNRILVIPSPTSSIYINVLHNAVINKIILNKKKSAEEHHVWKGDIIKLKTDFKNYNIEKIEIIPKGEYAQIIIFNNSGSQVIHKLIFKQVKVGETENIEIDKLPSSKLYIYGWLPAKSNKTQHKYKSIKWKK